MTRKPELKSIDCTSCGAGLDILGGGRVEMHVCAYCGACLKADEDYRAIAKFDAAQTCSSGLRIGMEGEIHGVLFRIIGSIAHEERYAGRVWNWTDHQLFSPTHGYAYLTVEKGHLIFSRKWRRRVTRSHSPAAIETAEKRPKVVSDGDVYKYYDYGKSTIISAVGEFNWVPKAGETATTVRYMSRDGKLGISGQGSEREVFRSSYLDQDKVARSFGLEPLKRSGVHALQPYKMSEGAFIIGSAALAFLMAAVISALIFLAISGDRIVRATHKAADLPVEVTFDLTEKDIDRLVQVTFSGKLENAWAFAEVAVYNPEDKVLFEAGRLLERYTGVQSGERWSEGRTTGKLRFRPDVPGVYTAEISAAETGIWKGKIYPLLEVTITIRKNVGHWLPMAFAAGVFAFFAVAVFGPKLIHQRRRWAGSDWSDD